MALRFEDRTCGPVVVEIPALTDAGLTGTLIDAWNVPLADIGPQGEDKGRGGRYLLAPPDYKGETPSAYVAIPGPDRGFNSTAFQHPRRRRPGALY